MSEEINWQVKHFSDLSLNELYEIIQLRLEVFVVEQDCVYQDLDDRDRHPETLHLFNYDDGKVASYLRILPAGLTYPNYASIGRVLTSENARGKALGHKIIIKALQEYQQHFNQTPLKISAQEHLQKFYQKHGFSSVGESYLEDDIPHIGMLYQLH